MANKNMNEKNNATINELTLAVNGKVTAKDLYGKLMSKGELDKAVKTSVFDKVECDGKVGYMNINARNYFLDAYRKAENLGTSAEWVQRLIISGTMQNEHYKESFVSDADFAKAIGQSTAYISKAKDAVEIREWLIANRYGSNWKPSTVEELIKTFKDFKKKQLDFNRFMKVTGLNSTATVKAVREAKKSYNESIVAPKQLSGTPITTSSVASGTPITTSSVASGTPITTSSVASDAPVSTSKSVGAYQSMSITINFDGHEPITIDLTDANERKLSNTILTALKGKIRVAMNK